MITNKRKTPIRPYSSCALISKHLIDNLVTAKTDVYFAIVFQVTCKLS